MSGPPAAGKTTNARPLADALGFPLFAMDPIKERLADAIGPTALALVDKLSVAAVHHLIDISTELIASGQNVLIEGFFRDGEFNHLLLPLVADTNAVLVHMWADDLLLKDRYENRALAHQRHWVHGDAARIGTLKEHLPEDMRTPLHLGIPRIFVNTSTVVMDVPAITAAVLNMLEQPSADDLYLGDMNE